MLKEICDLVNLADVLVALIFMRTLWMGVVKGLNSEFFKALGVLLTCFIGLHYFSGLAAFFGKHLPLSSIQTEILAVAVIWGIIGFLLRIVREAWIVSINPEGKVILSQRLGGAVLAFIRACLICGLIFFLIFTSGIPFLNRQVRTSWLGFHFQDTSFRVYDLIYDGAIHRIFPNENKNPALKKLKDRYKSKTQEE